MKETKNTILTELVTQKESTMINIMSFMMTIQIKKCLNTFRNKNNFIKLFKKRFKNNLKRRLNKSLKKTIFKSMKKNTLKHQKERRKKFTIQMMIKMKALKFL